jgi:DNA (cytosine-5)-methyltransferase 1
MKNCGKTLNYMLAACVLILIVSPTLAWCHHDYYTLRELAVSYVGIAALVAPYHKTSRVVRQRMTYISVCTGIAGCRIAWGGLGFKPLSFAEVDSFCSSLLDYHHPDVPNLGNFTQVDYSQHAKPDILVGGTPCQSFSTAGHRKGLDDPRGDLALHFLRVVRVTRPRWLVWENVAGILSSKRGRDLGTFLGLLAQIGYGFAYRILDAQHFGVPQRRRRIILVGHYRDWRCAAAVLFERHSFTGNRPPSPQTRQASPHRIETGLAGHNFAQSLKRAYFKSRICPTVTSKWAKHSGGPAGDECQNLIAIQCADGRSSRMHTTGVRRDQMYTLTATDRHGIGIPAMTSNGDGHSGYRDEHGLIMSFQPKFATRSHSGKPSAINHSLTTSCGTGDSALHIYSRMQVRRLTPRECERLQGFPDDYTLVPYRGKPATDGHRYRSLGNSWAIPKIRWIGERILAVESVLKHLEAQSC